MMYLFVIIIYIFTLFLCVLFARRVLRPVIKGFIKGKFGDVDSGSLVELKKQPLFFSFLGVTFLLLALAPLYILYKLGMIGLYYFLR